MLLFNRVANQIFYHKSHFLYFVYLCFADIPELLITFEPSMSIHEGSSLRLCCISNNSLPNETITWFNTKVGRQDRPNPTTACIHFVKVSRNYSGIYTCKAEQDGQRFTANIPLDVLRMFYFWFYTVSSINGPFRTYSMSGFYNTEHILKKY